MRPNSAAIWSGPRYNGSRYFTRERPVPVSERLFEHCVPFRNREERTGISCCSPHPLFSEDLVDLETLFYFALTVLRTIRRTSLAERVFQSYIDMKASSEWTIDSINSMLSAIFRTITGSVRSSIMEALNDLYSNRPKSAEELASRALSMDPDNLEAEIILTRALFSQTK